MEEEENPFEEPKSKSSGQPASKSGKSETKKSIVDYNYYLGSAKQASDYEIEFCPTDDMVADYMTKPLTGTKFMLFCCRLLSI